VATEKPNDGHRTPAEETPLSRMDRITILCKEYDTLRNEIIARTVAGYSAAGIAVILFVAWINARLTSQPYKAILSRSLFAAFLVSALLSSVVAYVGIMRPHNRVVALEREINRLAGENLLTWEGSISYFGLRQRSGRISARGKHQS